MESRTIRYGVTAFTALLLAFSGSACSPPPPQDARDPGVRNDGIDGAGGPLPGLPDPLQKLFGVSKDTFGEVEEVAKNGLGPRMNMNSCLGCHQNPAAGGSSPGDNPHFSFFNALVNHNTNKLPSFITEKGPVREARFKIFRYGENPNNTGPDGGVHDLFTIAGMKGAEGCKLTQPEFEEELWFNNVIFRIPTLFQTEREEDPNCQFTPTPSDATAPSHIMETDPKKRLDILSDIEKFAAFMRLLAPPTPSTSEPSEANSVVEQYNNLPETEKQDLLNFLRSL